MIRKYHNHKPQTTPCHCEEGPLSHHEIPGRQIKQSNQLSLPHQDDCNTRMDISNVQQNIEQLQTPTMGVTINKKSTTFLFDCTPVGQTPDSDGSNLKTHLLMRWYLPDTLAVVRPTGVYLLDFFVLFTVEPISLLYLLFISFH